MSYNAHVDDAAAATIWRQQWRPAVVPAPLAANVAGLRMPASLAAPTEQTPHTGGGTVPPSGGTTPPAGGGTGGGGAPNPSLPGPSAARPTLQRHVVALHLTGETTGGVAGTELRVIGPIATPMAIRRLQILPLSDVQPGQFVDVLVGSDPSTADTATPEGASLIEGALDASSLDAPDSELTLPVIAEGYDLVDPYATENSDRVIKIRSYVVTPGLTLPQLHVLVVYDELGDPVVGTSLPPSVPPVYPAPSPAPLPAPTPAPAPAPTPAYSFTAHWDYSVPSAVGIIIDKSDDPAIVAPVGYLWQAGSVPQSVLDAYVAGRITWGPTIQPTLYSPAPAGTLGL